jgi:tetratricopeptide (TPR) repeat protein
MSAPWQSADAYVPGFLIQNRWRVVQRLPGGMGTVVVASDTRHDTRVVCKFPSPKANLKAFEREARLMLGMSPHPNIVTVYQVERVTGRPMIVMHHYQDGDLSPWIGSPRLLVDLPLVLRLGLQVCDAMEHARRHGIAVHGDIKPSNLLLLHREVLALADFGLALAEEDESTRCGTPEYMAPEVFAGSAITEQSDVYSLGATLYEMLSGVPPFGARPRASVEELALAHQNEQPPTIEGIPDGIWLPISACLAKGPEGRPQGFAGVRSRLASAYADLVDYAAPAPSRELDMDPRDWTMRGLGLCELKRHEEETAWHRKAIELDPSLAGPRSNLANNLMELGRPHEALEEVDRALALDPRLAHALDIRGSLLDLLGRTEEGKLAFQEALRVDPRYEFAWYNLGLVLQNEGNDEEALRHYQKAVALRPSYAQAWLNMGCIWVRRGDPAQEEQCYLNALAENPCLDVVVTNYGAFLQRRGRHEDAIAFFDQVEAQCG